MSLAVRINPLWDQILIEPMMHSIDWELMEQALNHEQFNLMITISHRDMGEVEDFDTTITLYQMNIIETWLRQIVSSGLAEKESKMLLANDLLMAARKQENLALQAFCNPLAKEMREAGNTDYEILNHLGVSWAWGYKWMKQNGAKKWLTENPVYPRQDFFEMLKKENIIIQQEVQKMSKNNDYKSTFKSKILESLNAKTPSANIERTSNKKQDITL